MEQYKKQYVGNGQYCYTVNCSRHSRVIQLAHKYGSGSPQIVDRVSEIVKLVDRNHKILGPYYDGTEKKHFLEPLVAGSKFVDTSIRTIEDLLMLVSYQRGNLSGDDRNRFLKMGVLPEVFTSDSRYLFVKTPGKLGVVESGSLPKHTIVTVVRTKPLAPCSFVMATEQQPVTDFGVIVISQYLGKERFITAFPGAPTRVSRSRKNLNQVNSLEGQSFTVEQLEKKLGHSFTVHTQTVSHS